MSVRKQVFMELIFLKKYLNEFNFVAVIFIFYSIHLLHRTSSVPLLQVHFSNNDYLGVRVSFFWL